MAQKQIPEKIEKDRKIDFNVRDFIELLESYLSSTHLHGCRYIVDKKYNILAPFYWIILLLCMFSFCVCLISIQFGRYRDSAVSNVITSTGYPVWKSPFPAIAICNNNAVYKKRSKPIVQFLQNNNFDDEDIDDFLSNLSLLVDCEGCFQKAVSLNLSKSIEIYEVLEEYGYTINKIMKQLAHPCQRMLDKCQWKAKEVLCSKMFSLIKTNLGFCCGFNYFATLDEQEDINNFYFTGGAGKNSGFSVVVHIEQSEYVSSFTSEPGITVFIQDRLRYPQIGVQQNSMVAGETMWVEISQNVFKSDEDIVSLHPKSRGCLFEDEGNLTWTNIYNSQTCLGECRANYVHDICNCVPFYYPQTGNVSVCSMKDLECLMSNQNKFANIMLSDDPETDEEDMLKLGIDDAKLCYCLPSCNEVTYTIHDERKITPWNNDTCTINVYYNSVAGILRIRTATVTWDTLLGTIGGTFGLCMGGSIVSMLEFSFYFLQVIFGKKFIQRRAKKIAETPRVLRIKVLEKVQNVHM